MGALSAVSSNQPFSEQYRLAAVDWVRLEAAATMLENGKSAFTAQQIAKTTGKSEAEKERKVKASEAFSNYIKNMTNARAAANEAKVEVDYIKMKSWEHQAQDATRRAEMKMG